MISIGITKLKAVRKTWKLSEMFSSLLVGQFLVPPAVRVLYRDSRNYFFFLDLTSTLNDDRWGWRGGGLGAWGSPVILFSFPFIIFFPQQCQITSWWKYIPITLTARCVTCSARKVCSDKAKKIKSDRCSNHRYCESEINVWSSGIQLLITWLLSYFSNKMLTLSHYF